MVGCLSRPPLPNKLNQVAPGPPEDESDERGTLPGSAPSSTTSLNVHRSVGRTVDLFVGLSGSGKSLLIRQLQYLCNPRRFKKPEPEKIVQTIGLDFREFEFKRKKMAWREVGGIMQPLWLNFVSDVRAVIYTVDCSDPDKFGLAAAGLRTLIASPALKFARFIVVLTKCDAPTAVSRAIAEEQMELTSVAPKASVLRMNALDVEHVKGLLKWIREEHEGLAMGRPSSARA